MGFGVNRCSLYFTSPQHIEVRQEPVPALARDHVLVASMCSAISTGTELLIYQGMAPSHLALDESIAALPGKLEFPFKYGYALVGQVVELGQDVEPHWRDRLVFAFHPHESHFIAPPEQLIPLPAGMEPESALFLPNMETAINLVHDGRPLAGERVAVFGQGVVGLLTTALLSQYPLSRLVTLDHLPHRRKHALALGADASLDASQPEAVQQLIAELDSGAGYSGADLTFELSGNPNALDAAIAATGYNGRVVIGSWYGKKRAELDLGGRFHRSRIRLISSQVSSIAPSLLGRWDKERRLDFALDMIATVQPVRFITDRIPLSQAAAAYTKLVQRPHETLQVVLTYDEYGGI